MSRRGEMSPEDRRIWARIAGSVTPSRSRQPAREVSVSQKTPPVTPRTWAAPPRPVVPSPASSASRVPPRTRGTSDELEPRRQRRLSRERDPLDARIDLHGYGRFQAQDALTAFLLDAQARGYRAVLVITGQGRRRGTGVIRASLHEWLQSPALRGVVSGFAGAARKHGGDGAFYVTLRRP